MGESGTILATADGGQNWSPQTSGTTAFLEAVSFVDAQQGWVVGSSGTILATADGGQTWGPQTSGTSADLSGVSFVDAQHGWAVGDFDATILATSDGGQHWSPQTPATTGYLTRVTFLDAEHGWAVGWHIEITGDGGQNWAGVTAPDTLLDVAFVDAQHGWAVGANGTIIATTDGGQTWSPQTSGRTQALCGVSFVDDQHGWVVGINGIVLVTGDGGATWTQQTSGTPDFLYDVDFVDGTHGWAVGVASSNVASTIIAYGETPAAPTVTTAAVTAIGQTTVTGGGEVTDGGTQPVTARGVCWSTAPDPTIADDTTSDGSGAGAFTSSLTGLSPDTPYYVRAYATNSVGTSYGEQRQFTTAATPATPTVTTTAISGIGIASATSGGNVTDGGTQPVTARGVCWSTAPNPTIAGSKTTDGTGYGAFASSMTGLSSNTTYYVRAYATNSVGTSYGEQRQFTTVRIPAAPAVTVTGADAAWHGAPVNLTCTATVDPLCTLATMQYRTGGSSWSAWQNVPGSGHSRSLTMGAEGQNSVEVRVTDNCGATATASVTVKIDTTRPTVKATRKTTTLKRKRTGAISVMVTKKPAGCGEAKVTITIYKAKKVNGKVRLRKVKTLTGGWVVVNKASGLKYRPTLVRGTYTMKITSVDRVGNRQVRATTAKLKIK